MIEILLACQLTTAIVDWTGLSTQGWKVVGFYGPNSAGVTEYIISKTVPTFGVVQFPPQCENPKVSSRVVAP